MLALTVLTLVTSKKINSDLVQLRGKVVHPVPNNPLPDELTLAFIPELELLFNLGVRVSYQFGTFLFNELVFW